VFLSIKTYLVETILLQKFFDQDSNLKIFFLPGLEAKKVEKHRPIRLKGVTSIKLTGDSDNAVAVNVRLL